jgi:hypothetical protein
MSSRQEEKERRKRERIERERAEAAAAQRKRLVQIVGGVVVAVAVVVGIVIASSAGGKDKVGPGTPPANALPIPAQKITDLEDAAKAASCVLTNPPEEGRTHVTTKVQYKTNPPTSGNHAPPGEQASDGDYAGVESPAPERYVHSLEHGRIIIQYASKLPQRRVRQLETLWQESSATDFGLKSENGGFTLLMENNTAMPYEVAATAWTHMLACKTFNNKVFDAIRAFRKRYVLQAPEKVTGPE